MIYLYDNAIVDDLMLSFNPNHVENTVVKVVAPEQIIGLAAQIQNDEIGFPIVALTRNEDTSIDTSRMNFTRANRGVQAFMDTETNEMYYERAIPISLSYDLTLLTTNTADKDELLKEILFKYTSMYFLTIQLPYYCKRKIRFGIKVDTDSEIQHSSGIVEYIESGQLYQTIVPLKCDGCVMVNYTPTKLRRVSYEIEATNRHQKQKPYI